MDWILLALGVWVGSGLAVLLVSRPGRSFSWVGAAGVVLGAVLALPPVLGVLAGGEGVSFRRPWSAIPGAEWVLELDAISAWFLLPLLILAPAAALYGVGYFKGGGGGRSLGGAWFFFNLLVASLALVMVAANAVLFLVAWEVMALGSFFLVTFDDERESARRAGWVYLVAAHLGTAFLMAFFLLASRQAGSMDFSRWAAAGLGEGRVASVLFVLALVGFGAKAGLMPLHVWLPEAHPAAPSHVSALLSGVMLKTGIYGLVRVLTFLGPPPLWWGWVLLGVGAGSAVLGVVFALAQHDLKRLLAYSSVENVGLVTLGLGLGLIGVGANLPALAALGFAGALLHVVNHAVFKGLLFLGAGSVGHGAGTLDLNRLGGLLKRMRWTGTTFLVGAAAIAGLPPLSGFASELLLFLGAFEGIGATGAAAGAAGLAAVAALGLVSGLAAACFAKAFGPVFLGEPRGEEASRAVESGALMWGPMVGLALACAALGLGSPFLLAMMPNVLGLLGQPVVLLGLVSLGGAGETLMAVVLVAVLLAALVAGLALGRRLLLRRREVGEAVTWDCGYAAPSARMQYTGSSFSQPLTALFRPVLRTRRGGAKPEGLFPGGAAVDTDAPDLCQAGFYVPVFEAVYRGLTRLRWLQHGRVQLYVLYVALTLVVLLVWKLR